MPTFTAVVCLSVLLVCAGCGNGGVNAIPSGAPNPGGSTPNATVYDQIQQSSGWLTCGSCGDSGGPGALATYQMLQNIASPSLSGSSAEFTIGGTYPYANAYWYNRHPARNIAMRSLVYEFDLYVPSASLNAPQAIEFECQQRLNGYIYNFAWQAEYTNNRWRVFNYTARQWEDAGIALQRFAPDTWHHILAEYHNDSASHLTYHDALTVDGVRYPLSIVHAATPTTNTSDEFTNAFQLDLNATPVPYQVYIDRMKITQLD